MTTAFSRERVVKTFGKEAADFVELAVSLGWRVLFNSTGSSITLMPYDQSIAKRIHLSSKNKGRGALRKHIKVLTKFADPAKIETVGELVGSDSLPAEAKTVALQFMAEMRAMEDEHVVEDMPEEPKKERFVKATPKQEAPTPPSPKAVEEKVKKDRHIISERPALMHLRLTKGNRAGKSYPSKTTIERRWSDGTTDYACAVPTCGKSSENRLAFRGPHWAMHVRKGEAEPVDQEERDRSAIQDPNYTESAYTRKHAVRDKRTRELIALLKGLNLKKITVEDLAEQIMEFIASDMSGGGHGSVEDLTPEQILDRIRTLVDTGTYAEQEKAIIERDQQIEDLMNHAASRETELEAKMLDAEQRATVAEAHLGALRDLINESVGGAK